jgi:hypothetical protein
LELAVLGGTLTAIGAGLLARAATLEVAARDVVPALLQSVIVMVVVALLMRRGYGRAAAVAEPLPLGVALEARGSTVQRSAGGAAWATVAALLVDAFLERVVFENAGGSVPPAVLVGALWVGAGSAGAPPVAARHALAAAQRHDPAAGRDVAPPLPRPAPDALHALSRVPGGAAAAGARWPEPPSAALDVTSRVAAAARRRRPPDRRQGRRPPHAQPLGRPAALGREVHVRRVAGSTTSPSTCR